MRVSQAMTSNVRLASPDHTIREIAKLMADSDSGFIPLGENDRLVATITDRDLAVRAVAAGKGPDTPVREVMTRDVKYCYEDDEVENVARNMAEIKVRRMPVLNRDKRLVGVIALGDIAKSARNAAAEAMAEVSMPGGPHSR